MFEKIISETRYNAIGKENNGRAFFRGGGEYGATHTRDDKENNRQVVDIYYISNNPWMYAVFFRWSN